MNAQFFPLNPFRISILQVVTAAPGLRS